MEEKEKLSILRDKLVVAHNELEVVVENVEALEMQLEYLIQESKK